MKTNCAKLAAGQASVHDSDSRSQSATDSVTTTESTADSSERKSGMIAKGSSRKSVAGPWVCKCKCLLSFKDNFMLAQHCITQFAGSLSGAKCAGEPVDPSLLERQPLEIEGKPGLTAGAKCTKSGGCKCSYCGVVWPEEVWPRVNGEECGKCKQFWDWLLLGKPSAEKSKLKLPRRRRRSRAKRNKWSGKRGARRNSRE